MERVTLGDGFQVACLTRDQFDLLGAVMMPLGRQCSSLDCPLAVLYEFTSKEFEKSAVEPDDSGRVRMIMHELYCQLLWRGCTQEQLNYSS